MATRPLPIICYCSALEKHFDLERRSPTRRGAIFLFVLRAWSETGAPQDGASASFRGSPCWEFIAGSAEFRAGNTNRPYSSRNRALLTAQSLATAHRRALTG